MSEINEGRLDKGGVDPKNKTAWDPSTSGYGKHAYRRIDPNEVNPEEYARSLRGEEAHYGDVREYNCANNQKHPENTATVDWLGRIGTVFTTEAEGWKGTWIVTDLVRVKSPRLFVVAIKVPDKFNLPEGYGMDAYITYSLDETWRGQWKEMPADELGIAVDEKNLFPQVVTKVVKQGHISREMRLDALAKKK